MFETSFSHGAHVGVLERGGESVEGLDVTLGSEVYVGQTALVLSLFSYVHFIKLCNSFNVVLKNFNLNSLVTFTLCSRKIPHLGPNQSLTVSVFCS